MNEEVKKSNSMIKIIPIIIGVLLIAVGIFFIIGSNSSNTNKENKEESDTKEDLASAYEGIYAAENDKLFIRKTSNNEFHYIIGGNFEGTAIVKGDSAKEKNPFKNDEYFEFKLKDEDIELIYHAGENVEVAADTGIYKKVADYSKDNVYKEAVGDPKYLETKYSGLFKNDEVELYVFQISEKEIMVKSSDNNANIFIDEKFEEEVNEVNGETSFVAKSFFDEDKNAFLLNFYDNSIEIIVYDDVLDYDEEDKKLESNYKFERSITKEDIMNEFYNNY